MDNANGDIIIYQTYIKQLDMILSSTGEKLLTGAGNISHDKAIEKASHQ